MLMRPERVLPARASVVLGACAAIALALALPVAGAGADTQPAVPDQAQQPATSTPQLPSRRQLSDERRVSRWANPARLADIRTHHDGHSRKVGRLRFFTEDGFPEVYLLLNEYTDATAREWVQLRVPKRPNGRIGWVPRDALGPYHVVHTQLIVNQRALTVTLLKRGKRIFRARVGVGKASTKTPKGRFWIREKFRFKNTPVYGTFAMGTAAYAPGLTDWPGGGVIGMHGTNEPQLIPGRPSHGCIRLQNQKIRRLWHLTPIGTPLLIR